MKDQLTWGTTSWFDTLYLQDTTQLTTQAGLLFQTASSGISTYIFRKGDTASTPILLTPGTLGSYSSINPLPPTGFPVLTAVNTGGSIPANTYYGAWAYAANFGQSALSSFSGPLTVAGAANRITISPPAASSLATGWMFVLSTTSGNPSYLHGTVIASGGGGSPFGSGQETRVYSTSNTASTTTTVTGGGFVAKDNINMRGFYEFSYPNQAFASGYLYVDISVTGVNFPQICQHIELTAFNFQTASVNLYGGGLNSVVVELGLNARQALSIALAALAGQASGLNLLTPFYQAANNSSTNRISAIVDASGDRSTVTLNIPA